MKKDKEKGVLLILGKSNYMFHDDLRKIYQRCTPKEKKIIDEIYKEVFGEQPSSRHQE